MGRSYHDSDESFEKFKRKPKNFKKGRHTRSNDRQQLKDLFINNNGNEYLHDMNDEMLEKLEEQDE